MKVRALILVLMSVSFVVTFSYEGKLSPQKTNGDQFKAELKKIANDNRYSPDAKVLYDPAFADSQINMLLGEWRGIPGGELSTIIFTKEMILSLDVDGKKIPFYKYTGNARGMGVGIAIIRVRKGFYRRRIDVETPGKLKFYIIILDKNGDLRSSSVISEGGTLFLHGSILKKI